MGPEEVMHVAMCRFCSSFHVNWSAGRGMAVRSVDDGVGKGFGSVTSYFTCCPLKGNILGIL